MVFGAISYFQFYFEVCSQKSKLPVNNLCCSVVVVNSAEDTDAFKEWSIPLLLSFQDPL